MINRSTTALDTRNSLTTHCRWTRREAHQRKPKIRTRTGYKEAAPPHFGANPLRPLRGSAQPFRGFVQLAIAYPYLHLAPLQRSGCSHPGRFSGEATPLLPLPWLLDSR